MVGLEDDDGEVGQHLVVEVAMGYPADAAADGGDEGIGGDHRGRWIVAGGSDETSEGLVPGSGPSRPSP
jgi:hypothetical protein